MWASSRLWQPTGGSAVKYDTDIVMELSLFWSISVRGADWPLKQTMWLVESGSDHPLLLLTVLLTVSCDWSDLESSQRKKWMIFLVWSLKNLTGQHTIMASSQTSTFGRSWNTNRKAWSPECRVSALDIAHDLEAEWQHVFMPRWSHAGSVASVRCNCQLPHLTLQNSSAAGNGPPQDAFRYRRLNLSAVCNLNAGRVL